MLAAAKSRLSNVVLGGGVAANSALRNALAEACERRRLTFRAAPMRYCTDNAAMIAALGYHLFIAGDIADLEVDAYATGSLLDS
jgi:N6-L-threonylcarbamoyladenine synthase